MATNFDKLSEKVKGINNETIREKSLMMLKRVRILLVEKLTILPELMQK
jgi:hypothetical protein